QIGIMKAVGARTGQVMSMYLITVVIFGILSLIVAVPLGVLGANLFSRYIAGFLNFELTNFRLPAQVLLTQIGVGIFVPLVAAVYPIFAGVAVTVREAIAAYALGQGRFGGNFIDRVLLQTERVPFFRRNITRPLLLSLRNTFRRKMRLAFTLLTLILGGAIFISVLSVQASLAETLDSWLEYFQYDVGIQFDKDYRVDRLTREAMTVPGVVDAESWGFYNSRRLRPDGTDSSGIIIFAPPADTNLIKPTLVEGRWLTPEDTNAIVANTILLRDEPDVTLDSYITLKINGREESWKVVGIVKGGTLVATVFANHEYFSQVARDVGRAEWVFAVTEQHDVETQSAVAQALEQQFERRGLGINIVTKVAEERAEVEAVFAVIVALLLFMATLLAVIGGLGLMGTMSINVLERTREIGVIRAIGASNASVLRVFITEGIIIGLISWLIGAIVAYPVSKLLSDVVGQQFLSTSLNHAFSISGTLIWLVIVIVLATIASFLPAWNASRITVREVLAYE
ncbi:MAG: FtsX-like permease family protein, partial [Chloroflexota bacterium]